MGNLSPGEVAAIAVAALLALAGAVVTIGNAVEKLVKVWHAAKAPNDRQDERLAALEEWRKDVDRKLNNDKTQIEDAKECNHVLTKGMLALLEHGINGNNIDQMRDAKNGVEAYLINH